MNIPMWNLDFQRIFNNKSDFEFEVTFIIFHFQFSHTKNCASHDHTSSGGLNFAL